MHDAHAEKELSGDRHEPSWQCRQAQRDVRQLDAHAMVVDSQGFVQCI